MYDGLSGKRLMANKVSAEHFFIGGPFEANGGVFGINKTGSVCLRLFLTLLILPGVVIERQLEQHGTLCA